MALRMPRVIIIVLIALAAGLPGVFAMPPLDRDESRYAQATAQMLEGAPRCVDPEIADKTPGARWAAICFLDQQRNKKPAGIHWMQAASVAMFSDVGDRAMWAYRLPSLFGAILAVLATYWGGRALLGRGAAAVGSAFLGASVLVGAEAGIAKTDAMLLAMTTFALAAMARLYVNARKHGDRPGAPPGSKGLAFIFWVAMAGGVMIKGPITPMVAGLALAAITLLDGVSGRPVRWATRLFWWPGLIAFVLLAAPWLVAIGVLTEGRFFVEALGGDLGQKVVSAQETHGGWIGYHTSLAPLLIFPATVVLLPGIYRAFAALSRNADGPESSGLRFLLAWALPTWIVFELVPTKLSHYTMPAYPALALMAGAALVALIERRMTKWVWAAMAVSCALAGLIAVVLVTVLVIAPPVITDAANNGDAVENFEAFLTLLGSQIGGIGGVAAGIGLLALWIGGAAGAFFALVRAPRFALAGLIVLAIGWHVAALQLVTPRQDALFIAKSASFELQGLGQHPTLSLNGKPVIAVTGFYEPSFVFLMRGQVALSTPEEAAAMAAGDPGRITVVEEREAPAFVQAMDARGASYILLPDVITGLNYSNGDPVRLAFFRTN